MSREICEFSAMIDERFDYTEQPAGGILNFLFSLFA